MRTAPRSFALLSPAAFALLAALAPASAHAAWSTSPYVNLPVTLTAGTSASSQTVLSDGVGGAFVAWADGRNQATTGYDIYLAHILKTGVMDPAWPVNGLAVCAAAGDQTGPVLVADNTGGAIVVWRDGRAATSDIFGARVNSNGTLASGWTTPNGKQIGAATPSGIARDEYAQVACSDGVGGVIVAWGLIYTPNSDEDIYAVRILANGNVAAGWQANGSVIDAASGFQINPCIASDGAGGAIIAFVDNFLVPAPQIRYRTVSFAGVVTIPASDLVSAANGIGQSLPIGVSDGLNGMFIAWSDQRISPAGVGIADITPAGPGGSPFYYSNPIFGTALDISVPEQIVPDGVGGLYLSWWDASSSRPIHLTHVTGNATWAPGWNTSGVPIGQHTNAAIVPDGTSGVMAAFFDGYDIQGARYLSGGAPGTGWTSPDYVSEASNFQETPVACSDGSNGMIAVWQDERDQYRGLSGLYAQRVDRFGALGDASAQMAGVKDTPNDQGGHVRVNWNPSYLDAEPARGISSYYVFRQLPQSFAVQQVKAGRFKLAADESAPHDAKTLRVTRDAVTSYYWEQIATVPALQLPGYSFEAATAGDSVPGSNPYTVFMVEATANTGAYWMSAPDSGYSKDNLPPLPPAPVSAAYAPGGTSFHWRPNTEADLATYRIYRLPSSNEGPPFTPNIIATTTDTTYFDATPDPWLYAMTAVDAHGNESGFTGVTPSGVLAVTGSVPHELAFAIASQNPAPGRVSFRLTLPNEMNVRVALYDASGRRVRTLASGTQPAGEQTLRWDGSDESGRAAASGLYFARFDGNGRTLVRRFVIER